MTRLPSSLRLTFYGDDFTGSTDVLESLALAGVSSALFLAPPDADVLKRYPGLAAVGVAGTSRSRDPAWMDAELPAVFAGLKALGAPICHYKTCSTFDSAPHVGNIGRAAEIGRGIFGQPVPVVVGVPRLGRYVLFSNLFAAASIAAGQDVFRIDRHPTMSRHPVTPMDEADLRRHLARQTDLRIAGFDFRQMLAQDAATLWAEATANADILILDGFDDATTRAAGKLLSDCAAATPFFVVGSSGVEYALVDAWRGEGALAPAPVLQPCGPVDSLLAVCGSCSPVTADQIAWAEANGFALVAVDTAALIDGGEAAEAALVSTVLTTLGSRKNVVLHTARGPDDPRIAATRAVLQKHGYNAFDSSRLIGGATGRVTRRVLADAGIPRVLLAGGDSSSHAISAMGVEALTVAGPMVPGAPLCRIHSGDETVDGVEILLKGGQVGKTDFFGRMRNGK